MKELIKKFIPLFILSWYHFGLAALGAIIYRFPSKKLIVIGVTGTNGKSTVVDLTTKILEEAGHKVASLSSIKFKIGNKEWKNTLKMTMPGRLKLQKFLREAVNAGCQYAVLEITSEGILQHRHRFIDFNVAVITNLTPEHIESHGSFENYKKTKAKLFQVTKGTYIINLDDKNSEYFLKFPAKEKITFTTKEQDRGRTSIKSENIEVLSSGLRFSVKGIKFNLKLLGKFNIYNSLAAICAGLSQGIDIEICKKALEKAERIPGRMEIVIQKPFQVIVDYAHTPDALKKVYQTIQEIRNKKQETRMICVLGAAGGGRDKWKRPELGRIAGKFCNQIILTDEDPYDENPSQILSEIKFGILNLKSKISNFYEILDRREAIKKALSLVRAGDIIIITGKGCEPWMCVAKGKKISWDDRKIVKQEFKKINFKYEKI